MDIIQAFSQLKEKEISLDLLSEVIELREMCEEQDNNEYYFQCSNLIIDIFISEGLLDDALKTALMTQELLDDNKNDYQESYKKLLDSLAYIYIIPYIEATVVNFYEKIKTENVTAITE